MENDSLYHSNDDNSSLIRTIFFDSFIGVIIVFFIFILIFEIIINLTFINEYPENFNIFDLNYLGSQIFLFLFLGIFFIITLISAPFFQKFRMELGLVEYSKINLKITNNKISIWYNWPIYSSPMIPFWHDKIKNSIKINNINKIYPYTNANEEVKIPTFIKIIPYKFYKIPGITQLSGALNENIIIIELKKPIKYYNYDLTRTPLFGKPKGIKTKIIYLDLEIYGRDHLLSLLNRDTNHLS